MTRLINGFHSAALILIMTSFATGQICRDRFRSCPSYRSLCNNTQIRSQCLLTCNTCTSVAVVVNPCRPNYGGCHHICRGLNGQAVCSCFPGFKLSADQRKCKDIDECRERPNSCPIDPPSFCVNTIGSYSCQEYNCNKGYMNYYRSSGCCRVKNGTCGMTSSIQGRLPLPGGFRNDVPRIRVFGGQPATVSAWPWQAQIVHRGFHHCGASLIAHKWLVGAAHCFRSYYHYRDMLVYFGMIRSAHIHRWDSSMRQQRTIRQVITPGTSEGYSDDVALIELTRPVVYNDVIRPICLPCGEVPNIGDKCWVTGFGRTETSGRRASNALLEVDVPIVENSACAVAYRDEYEFNEEQMVCAGYEEGRKDTCIGDSGGPLACQRNSSCEWYLSGVTSFGKGCGLPGYYGVYTKIVNYENWIVQTIGSNATGLCERMFNPCRRTRNIDNDCYSKLDRCTTFPHYMKTNCQKACCQLRNNEISNCYDDPSSATLCAFYSTQCNHRLLRRLLADKCKKTCKIC